MHCSHGWRIQIQFGWLATPCSGLYQPCWELFVVRYRFEQHNGERRNHEHGLWLCATESPTDAVQCEQGLRHVRCRAGLQGVTGCVLFFQEPDVLLPRETSCARKSSKSTSRPSLCVSCLNRWGVGFPVYTSDFWMPARHRC